MTSTCSSRRGCAEVSQWFQSAMPKSIPLVDGYDPEKPSSRILYLDANNLYGWAMSQPLPTGAFRWEENCKQLAKTIADHPADDPETWSTQKTYTTRTMHIRWHRSGWWFRKWMSEYQHNLPGFGVAPKEVEKLVPNLRNKDRYVLHYRNLQLYTFLGMLLTKVHRALRFDQSPWMKPYIRMNTELRKNTASDFEKDLYKLMNNSVFGKTMENLQKRGVVNQVGSHEEDKLRRLIASPAFARANIFDDDLAAI